MDSWSRLSRVFNGAAGRVKPTRIRPENRYLNPAGHRCSVDRCPLQGANLGARNKRIVVRTGTKEAPVATEHSFVTAFWHMLSDCECHHDPGSDHLTQQDLARASANWARTTPTPSAR